MRRPLGCIPSRIRVWVIFFAVAAFASDGWAALPIVPGDLEARPSSETALPITLTWDASLGTTSYNVYRGTSPGGEAPIPYATVTKNQFVDTNVSAGPPLIYFYKVSAVSAGGESGKSDESSSPTPLPRSTGNGSVAGVISGNRATYYGKDA